MDKSPSAVEKGSMIVNNRAWGWIWCPSCGEVREFTFDVMHANNDNDHDAADFCCVTCRFVIATMHDSPRG